MQPFHPTKRVEYIDLLRGWAVIVMIETHVANATLSSDILASGAFQYIKFVNGLVAPAFLFASGLAYAVTTRRKIADYLTFQKPLGDFFIRLFAVFTIGYMLHIPIFSLERLLTEATDSQWKSFFQVDVLQCIAASLLFMQLLLLVLRSEARFYLSLVLFGIAVIALTPVMWGVNFRDILPWPVAAYMNGRSFSLFPLFPWSAFLFAGAIVGYLHQKVRSHTARENAMMSSLIWAGGCAILLSILVEPVAASFYPVYDYWLFSPSFVLLRLGIVMGLCAGLFFYERLYGVSARSIVTLIGRESLLVYVVHLLMIYGKFGPFNFQEAVNHSFGYLEVFLVSVGVLASMIVLARWWGRVKRTSPRMRRILSLSVLMIVIGMLLFGPGE